MTIVSDSATPLVTIPYRLRIGVSGHRHLKESDLLRGRVREVLDRILAHFPSSSSTPIALTVVSSLAEGADRLVVTEVLKKENSRLDAVIPLLPDDYKADFRDDDSRREFEQLLARDSDPLFFRDRPLSEDLPPDTLAEARPRAYREAGEFVARHCDVLIAIWNMENAKGEGGTANIVAFARTQGLPVYVIGAPAPHDITEHWGNGIDLSGYRSLEEYNTASVAEEVEAAVEHDFVRAFAEPPVVDLPRENIEVVRAALMPRYLRASALSRRNQCRYFRIGVAIYSLAGLAVLLVIAGAMIPRFAIPLFAAEAVSLLLIVVVVTLAQRRDFHRKWVSYRFLAERLRASCVLTACGFPDPPVRPAAGKSLPREQDEWTDRAYAEIAEQIPRTRLNITIGLDSQRKFLKNAWLTGQERYHREKAARDRRKNVRLEIMANIVFYAAIGCVLLHVMFLALESRTESEMLTRFLTLLALGLPALGATLVGIRKHREYDRLSSRSRSVELQLIELARQLDFADTPERMRRAARNVDELILAESQDWRVLVGFLVPTKPA